MKKLGCLFPIDCRWLSESLIRHSSFWKPEKAPGQRKTGGSHSCHRSQSGKKGQVLYGRDANSICQGATWKYFLKYYASLKDACLCSLGRKIQWFLKELPFDLSPWGLWHSISNKGGKESRKWLFRQNKEDEYHKGDMKPEALWRHVGIKAEITTCRYWSGKTILISFKRWCCESAELNMPADLENSAVATGLENVSVHSNPKERQLQRMLKLPHNCTHLTR